MLKEPKGSLMFSIIVSENQFPFAILILAGVTHFVNFIFTQPAANQLNSFARKFLRLIRAAPPSLVCVRKGLGEARGRYVASLIML